MKKPKRSSLSVILLLSVFSLLGVFVILAKFKPKKDIPYEISKLPIPTITPTPIPISSMHLILKKNTESGWENILSWNVDPTTLLSRWNNYILYTNSERDIPHNKNNIQIWKYNLDTEEAHLVFEYKNTSYDFSDLIVIDNNLFFSLGGYLLKGRVYALNLPNGQAQIIANAQNSSIQKREDNRYWLVGGEGDACWSEGYQSVLNPNTKKVSHILTTSFGCGGGEEYLGQDMASDELLTAYSVTDNDGLPAKKPEELGYKYVMAIPISNPKAKHFLVTKADMPQFIKSIKYFPNQNSLLLTGPNAVYSLDLKSKKLVKLTDLNLNLSSTNPISWNEDVICISTSTNYQDRIYGLILQTKELIENHPSCQTPKKDQASYDEEEKLQIKTQIDSLNLPANFKIDLQ